MPGPQASAAHRSKSEEKKFEPKSVKSDYEGNTHDYNIESLPSTTFSFIREQIKAITHIENSLFLDTIFSYIDFDSPLTQALKTFYRTRNQLETPMLRSPQPIMDINLSITETRQESKQAIKDEKDKKSDKNHNKQFTPHLQHFEQMYNINAAESIKPENIFDRRNEDKQDPKKVLILGRAGIGKTTMSQYFAHRWAIGKLWDQQFDYVFWIPLRNFGKPHYQSQAQLNLAGFIHAECLSAEDQKKINVAEIEKILTENQSRILLLLDGYDEIAHLLTGREPGSSLVAVLTKMLEFPQLLLTSRPYHTQGLKNFDRELENMGFTDANIESYVTRYFNTFKPPQPEQAKALLAFLKASPSVWGSAHIPINLALICDVWQSQQKKQRVQKPSEYVNLTRLYGEIVEHLLERNLSKEAILDNKENELTFKQLRAKCSKEMDCLERLAFEGFMGKFINLEPDLQKQIIEETGASFTIVLKLGFLRNTDGSLEENLGKEIKKSHYFIHLTFQEYFAARYIVSCLQQSNTKLCQQAIHFIQTQKYHPRYQIILGFVAGLLSSEHPIILKSQLSPALIRFWNAILSHPLDLTSINHICLIIRLLEEANCDARIPYRDKLISEIQLWGKNSLENLSNITKKLYTQLQLSPAVIKHCQLQIARSTAAVKNKVLNVPFRSHDDLSLYSSNRDSIDNFVRDCLLELDHKDLITRKLARANLNEVINGNHLAIKTLIKLSYGGHLHLYARNSNIKNLADNILNQLSKEKNKTTLKHFIRLLDDENLFIQKSVVEMLGNFGDSSDIVITALLQTLGNPNRYIRQAAIAALHHLGKSDPEITKNLLKNIMNFNDLIGKVLEQHLIEIGELNKKLNSVGISEPHKLLEKLSREEWMLFLEQCLGETDAYDFLNKLDNQKNDMKRLDIILERYIHALENFSISIATLLTFSNAEISKLIEYNCVLSATPLPILIQAYFQKKNIEWATLIAKRTFFDGLAITINDNGIILHEVEESLIPWPPGEKKKLARELIKVFTEVAEKLGLPHAIPKAYLSGIPIFPAVPVPVDVVADSKATTVVNNYIQHQTVNNVYSFFHSQNTVTIGDNNFLQDVKIETSACLVM